ncbi:unnamed protein product [Cladocopium goreaui]|uniref:Uncharacterized protein n=1 Tax=Cladocopium goreaui TaxID=2562237 RepID=A0A9P1FIF9_9DINO|nr:unnamed protein product [Cladocopium goreaui]
MACMKCAGINFVAFVLQLALAGQVEVCPGEGPRYGDHKCNHDGTHRVCAKLLDSSGKPMIWGQGDFWEITSQKRFQWDSTIRANGGDSWCICMWAFARMVEAVGCDNVHLRCNATDLDFVLASYQDRGVTGRVHDLRDAHSCMKKKCLEMPEEPDTTEMFAINGIVLLQGGCLCRQAASFNATGRKTFRFC